MRDPESIAITLTLAETGHLVLSSLHTNDAPQALDRIVDVFTADRQGQIRLQLASTLSARDRAAARPARRRRTHRRLRGAARRRRRCSNLVREGKTNQLRNAMQMALERRPQDAGDVAQRAGRGRDHHAGDGGGDRVRPRTRSRAPAWFRRSRRSAVPRRGALAADLTHALGSSEPARSVAGTPSQQVWPLFVFSVSESVALAPAASVTVTLNVALPLPGAFPATAPAEFTVVPHAGKPGDDHVQRAGAIRRSHIEAERLVLLHVARRRRCNLRRRVDRQRVVAALALGRRGGVGSSHRDRCFVTVTVGVPEITPVTASIDMPLGKPTTFHEYEPVPPVAVIVAGG